MQNQHCVCETRIVSILREKLGGLLNIESGLNVNFGCSARLMRAQSRDRSRLERILDEQAFADVRRTLWAFGGQIVSGKYELVPETTPLRSFWPEKFVEPVRTKLTKTEITTARSFWWKIAPFELRMIADQGSVGTWTIRSEVESRQVVDSNLNTPIEGETKWIGQVVREFKLSEQTCFVRIFRWNPFK